MPRQSDISSIGDHGMFFEQYIFDPRTNFTEEDLHYVVQFIDITFNDDVEVPHPQHFEGRVFRPQPGLTVAEMADILSETHLRAPDEYLAKLPEKLRDQFEDGMFVPFDDFSMEDMVMFLTSFVRLRLGTPQFNTLPRHVQRQFIVFTREGKHWRYGDRIPT